MTGPLSPAPGARLAMLTRYKAWADALLYAMLAKLPASELTAPRRLFTGNLLRMLNHVYSMDLVWQSHLLGVPHGLTTRNPETTPPFTELLDTQRMIDAWYTDYAAGMTAEQYDEIVAFTFIGGGTAAMRREDILLHVVNHTTYHRGHVSGVLYQLGIEAPTTDLPVFLREQAAHLANRSH